MTSLIYIWALLAAPSDRLICQMWVGQPPTQAQMALAGCTWTAEQAAAYVWRSLEISTGSLICERPAAELPTLTCDLWPLDRYVLRVVQPAHRAQLCSLNIRHPGPPTDAEIAEQCGEIHEAYTAEWVSTGQESQPEPPAPVCQMPALTLADLPASIATSNDYFLLDYELLWWFGEGRGTIYRAPTWQNQWDAAIQEAGRIYSVPPRLIKAMFAQESQFWPLWAPERKHADEVGLGQLTDDGADLALRYSPGLYAQLCPLAAWDCNPGYDTQPDPVRQMLRDILRSHLMVNGTPLQAAEQAAATIPTWAQILAAYYCAAGELVRPNAAPAWDYALAAYHAGPECVRGGEICAAGKGYLEEIKK